MLQSLLNSGYQTLNNIPRESFCLTIQIIAGPIGHPKMLHHLHCSKNVCSPSSFQIWHVNNNILILSNSLHDSKNSCSIRPFQELWVILANSITAGELHRFRKGGYPTPVHLLWVMIKTPRMLGPLYHSIFSWLLLLSKMHFTYYIQSTVGRVPYSIQRTMNCGSSVLFHELWVTYVIPRIEGPPLSKLKTDGLLTPFSQWQVPYNIARKAGCLHH